MLACPGHAAILSDRARRLLLQVLMRAMLRVTSAGPLFALALGGGVAGPARAKYPVCLRGKTCARSPVPILCSQASVCEAVGQLE